MDKIVLQVLEFLERWLPSVLGAYLLGKKNGLEEKQRVENELVKKEYELEKLKNEKQVEIDNQNKSPNDTIRDAISKGRNLK